MAHSVFISYSSQDKKVADAVCATLEHRKIRCWIAPRDVLSGIPYAEALIRAINESSIMVLVFSSSSNDSPQVMREVERAVDKGLPIIPFRIENVIPSKAMEYYLSAPHWLDAITPPLEKHLRKLADTVQALLAEVEKPHTKEEEKEEKSIESETKAATGRKRKGLYAAVGIVVAAAIIVGIVLATGGSGDDNGEIVGPGPTTTPGGSLVSTTVPPTTSGGAPAGETTTPADETTAPADTTTPASTTTTTPGGNGGGTGSSALVSQDIESGSYIEDEISFTGEIHWYSFYAEEGDAVYIVLFDRTEEGEMIPWLGLIGPDGKVIVEDNDWPNYNAVQIYHWATQTGEYTIRVRDQNLGTGPYALAFSQFSETAQPISPGAIQSSLDYPGEAHWYTFDGNAGDTVYIVLVDTTEGPLRPWLTLLNPEKKVVFDDNDWPNYEASQTDYVLLDSGQYVILVRDGALLGGSYTLTFNMLVSE